MLGVRLSSYGCALEVGRREEGMLKIRLLNGALFTKLGREFVFCSILIVLKLNNSMIVINHSLTLFGNGLWVFMLIEKETSPWASFS